MNNAGARYSLEKTIAMHTTFCAFTVLDGGMVRVSAYATHTNYVNDQIVTVEEARKAWKEKIAAGFTASK